MHPIAILLLIVGASIGLAILAAFLNQVIAVLSPQGFLLLVGAVAAVVFLGFISKFR